MARLHLGKDASDQAIELKPSSLRTHGVVVGMTGSGKTGLCLVMLEELVRAGVPVIAIDPKGDLGNLGLVFPSLDAASFAPWADGAEPEKLATTWRQGLAGWGYGPEQLSELKDKLDLSLYTPGSEAGIPVDLLGMLAAPPADQLQDLEGLRGLVRDTVSGLLGLVGRSTDPVRDPAHVVLSHVLEKAWTAGQDLDLEAVITQLVDPPFEKVGVFPTDRFFPPDDRMDLAMQLNGVIASPAFASWTKGEALDVDRMLRVEGGRVPVSVFSIAHLPETERHFFAALLLGRILAWSRSQPGTERLRAVVFFDEVAGYLPPHPKNPASKAPLLMLMKQARAMGLGVLLATQNPVDVDYKALSNAGLWAIGRLRTEQDRKRLLKGLDPGLDGEVQALGKRQFLLARAKGGHTVFSTRWAMCYLRGPFTRQEIASFQAPRALPERPSPPAAAPPPPPEPAPPELPDTPPPLEQVDQVYLDPRVAQGARLGSTLQFMAEPPRPDGRTRWVPALWAEMVLHFQSSRHGFSLDHHEHRLLFPLPELGLSGEEQLRLPLEASDLLGSPPSGALFEALPAWLDEDKEWKAAQKQLVDEVYRSETRGMFVHRALRFYGRGGESREDFEARCTEQLQERIDAGIAKLRQRYEKKVDTLEDRIRARERKLEDYEGAVRSRKAEEAVNVGETVLSFFTGRRKSLSTAMTRRSRTREAQARVERTEDEIGDLKEQIAELLEELKEQVEDIRQKELDKLQDIEEREVRLRKQDIQLRRFGLLWVPVTRRI